MCVVWSLLFVAWCVLLVDRSSLFALGYSLLAVCWFVFNVLNFVCCLVFAVGFSVAGCLLFVDCCLLFAH